MLNSEGEYKEAIKNYFKSLEIYELKMKNSINCGLTYNNIGNVYAN
jgi:hypothetical protein